MSTHTTYDDLPDQFSSFGAADTVSTIPKPKQTARWFSLQEKKNLVLFVIVDNFTQISRLTNVEHCKQFVIRAKLFVYILTSSTIMDFLSLSLSLSEVFIGSLEKRA